MKKRTAAVSAIFLAATLIIPVAASWSQPEKPPSERGTLTDAVQDAQTPRDVPRTRPEQQVSRHDASDLFDPKKAPPSSTAFKNQPDEGKILGFDFFRDPLNAKKPMMTFQEIYKADVAAKPNVMQTQRRLLEQRYDLTPRLSREVRMTRGKPIATGPTGSAASHSRLPGVS